MIVDGEVRTLVEPGLTATEAPPDLDVARVQAQAGRAPFTVGSVGADTRFRVRVQAQGPLGRTVVYALPLDDVDATLRRLLVVELGGSAIILAVLGLVMFWVVRLGVRPIKEMTTVAQAIGQGDLSHRIPDSTPGTEAGELGGALNDMLSRIEDAFRQRAESEDRLRRFVGDASHELRTPITTIRGYAELYGSGGLQDPNDLDQAMRRTQQEATRMGRLVEDLLHLARLDQGRPLEPVALDAAALLADAARDPRRGGPRAPGAGPGQRTIAVGGRRSPVASGRGQPGRQRPHPHGPEHAHHAPGTTGTRRRPPEARGTGHDPGRGDPRLRALLPGRPGPGSSHRRQRPGVVHRGVDRRRPPRHGRPQRPRPWDHRLGAPPPGHDPTTSTVTDRSSNDTTCRAACPSPVPVPSDLPG